LKIIKSTLNKINCSESYRRVSKAIIFGVGGAVSSRVLMMLTTVVVARVLSKDLYGKYSLINSTVQLFVLFAGMGIGATLNRYTALYYKSDKKKVGQIITTLYIFTILLSLALSVTLFIISKSISLWTTNNIELTGYFRLTAGTVFFTAISSIEQSILQGMEKYKTNAKIQIITCMISLIFSSIFVFLLNLKGSIIALLLTQILNFVLLRKAVKKELEINNIQLEICFNNEIKDAILHFTIPSFISSIFVLPVTWLNNMLLVKYSGFSEMAIFSIALQWFTILTYIPNQLGQVRPIYTDYYARNKKSELKNIIYKLTGYSTGLVVIISLGILIFGRYILLMYGSSYVNNYLIFAIMILTSVIVASQSQVGALIQASGKMWLGFFLNIIWAFILYISFYFMRDLGSLGYAIAYSISYAVHTINSFIVLFVILRRMNND